LLFLNPLELPVAAVANQGEFELALDPQTPTETPDHISAADYKGPISGGFSSSSIANL